MFFIHRSVPVFPQHTHRPDYYQPSPEERYYRQIAEEHNRRADIALRLAQQEQQRVLREREVRVFRARQYQQELASQAQSGHPYWNHRRPQIHPLDLIFSFGSDEQPTRACSMERHTHRRPRSFFDPSSRGMDAPVEHRPSCAGRRAQCATRQAQAHKMDKGKARAPVQEPAPTSRQQVPPKADDPLTALFHLFGGLGALEEEDAIVRQLNLFGANSYPGLAQHGVAGPSGTRQRSDPSSTSATAATSASPSSKPATAVPIKKPAQSTPSSASSSPKSHAASFTSLDAIQSRFDTLKSSFVFPDSPHFELAGSNSSGIPKLAYSASNASVHDYENELTKLLAKLDAVESDGAESIRGVRKALVVAVEKELDRLDEEKKTAWRNSLVLEAVTPGLEVDSVVDPSVGLEAFATISEEVAGYDVGEPDEVVVPQEALSQLGEQSESSDTSESQLPEQSRTVTPKQTSQSGLAEAVVHERTTSPELVAEGSMDHSSEVVVSELAETPAPLGSHKVSETMAEAVGASEDVGHSEFDTDPFVEVQEGSPAVSEASLDDTQTVSHITAELVKDVHSDDEFEML
ncbi:hypothetical protein FRB90_002729 [Tulasnella sp. 427]|nr:hypothetical protein FRB90_002729 [Tulasnella sp. 427]